MNWYAPSSLNLDYDSEKELGEDTGFLENFNVAYDHEQAENLGNSESITMMEDVNNAYTALYEYTGQARFDTLSDYGNSVAGFDLDLRDLGAEQDLIRKLRQQHPDDTRLRTYEQMIADKKPELKALRERSQDVYDRAGVMGTVGTFLGIMGAHVKDPLFMYSLPFGAGPTTAKSALGRAVQVGAKEAVIAGVAEVPVSVSRYQWKEKIESPWSVWDAAEETLMVMTGTGLLSGVGYAIGDALGWTHAAKVARENGLEGEAQILEKRAKVIEESEAQGVPVEEVLDARVEAESQMGHFDDRPITRTNLYHGSDSIFSEFKDDMIGSANDAGFYGAGHYFTDNTGEAKYYGPHVSEWMTNANIIDLIGDSTGRTHDYEGFINYARNLDEIGALDEEHQQALKAITDVNEYIDDNVDFLLKDNADGSEGFIARIDDPVQRSDTDPEYDYVDKFEPNYNMRDAPLTKDEAIKDLKEHFIRTMDEVRTGGLGHYSDYVNEHFPGLLVDRKESLADYVRTRPNGAMVLTEKAQAAGYEGIKAGDETVIFDAKNIKAVPKEPTVIYHGTAETFDDFDLDKTADGTVWFTDNKALVDSGEVGASGQGQVIERVIDEDKLKLAGWDEDDKFSTGELIDQGYDGLKLVEDDQTTYRIFDPAKLSKVGEAKKSAEVTPFRKDTELTDIDDMFNKPHLKEYFRDEKHKEAYQIEVTPDAYLDALKSTDFDIDGSISQTKVDEYADRMLKGDKFPALLYDIHRGFISQEGRHRALAAKKIGVKSLPVSVVYETGKVDKVPSELSAVSKESTKPTESKTGNTAEALSQAIAKNFRGESPSKYSADLEVPGTPILEGSEVTATVRSYAEVMEEFDAEEQLWKDVETCMMGLADGK